MDGMNDNDVDVECAAREKARLVLIFFRGDGRGGIQGIVLDSFYMDREGRIANEFFVVRDVDECEMEKVEGGIHQLTDSIEIQKVFYKYFLKTRPSLSLNK